MQKNSMSNVIDHGAKGDGVSDDTLAFRNAIASAHHVFIPFSERGYLISETLALNKPAIIAGQNKSKIIANASLFSIESSDIRISGLDIHMDKAGPGTAAFYLNTCKSSLEKVYIEHSEVSHAFHMIIDGDHNKNIVVNLHLNDLISWYGRCTQIMLRDAFAYLFVKNVTIDQARNVGAVIDFPFISLANNEGSTFTDVHINGNGKPSEQGIGAGFFFLNSRAVWLTRSMADTTGGYGFWFDNSHYIYLTDVVASLNTHGGFVFTGSSYITGANVIAAGRKGLPETLEHAHGFKLVNSSQAQITNLSSRNNTGVGLIVSGCSSSILNNLLLPNNGSDILQENNEKVVVVNYL